MKKPYIKQVQAPKKQEEAIVFVDGYMSEYKNINTILMTEFLRKQNWQGAIYRFCWDAGSQDGMKYSFSPLGQIPLIGEAIHIYPHWRMVVERGKKSGLKFFPKIIASLPEQQVSLMGYSLGCRVIHYGMLAFNPELSNVTIKNLFLFAGAIRRIRWGKSAQKITGNIYNFYNRNDDTLEQYFTQFGLYPHKPCGIAPIRESHLKIKNIDITSSMGTHSHDLEHYLRGSKIHQLL